MQEHIKPETRPACPACGCRFVNIIMLEPDPGETGTAPIGDRPWQKEEPPELVKTYNCKKCGHDQTAAIEAILPRTPTQLRRVFHELGQMAKRLRGGLIQ